MFTQHLLIDSLSDLENGDHSLCSARPQKIIMKLWLKGYQPIFLATSVEKPDLI